jgi:hypothetical protein
MFGVPPEHGAQIHIGHHYYETYNFKCYFNTSAASVAEFSATGILEAVHHRLLQAHLFKMSEAELTLQNLKHAFAQNLSCGHKAVEIREHVEILVIEAVEDFGANTLVEIDDVADHSGVCDDGAADRDFDKIVVAVSVRIIAFAVGGLVLGVGERVGVEAMRRREHVTPS